MTSKQSSKSKARKNPARELQKSARKKPAAAPKAAKPAALVGAIRFPAAATPPAARSKSDAHGAPVAPTELSSEVMEFITAIDKYKRTNRRPFPSWSEVFEIVKALGYQRSA